jgi:hypothetical protein
MIAQVIDEINENLDQLSEKDRDWNFCRAMDAHYLDDSIPCVICDVDFYIRSYEKVNSELMFGDESNATP